MKFAIPNIISEQELINIVNNTKANHHKLAFMLGFYQAMRVSEVVNLTSQNIDKPSKLIMIKQSKGSKDRNIPISPEIIKHLKHLPIKCGIRALQIAVKRASKRIIQKDIHFHTLRHSGATHYLNKKKWNIRVLQNFLGHSNLNTTQIYTHVSAEEMMKVMWE